MITHRFDLYLTRKQLFMIIADGFVRAESVVVVFLQKLKDARRVYANIIHTKSNSDGFKNEGPSSPSGKSQQELYRKFYDEIDINPNLVSYVETHGTGTKVSKSSNSVLLIEFRNTRTCSL